MMTFTTNPKFGIFSAGFQKFTWPFLLMSLLWVMNACTPSTTTDPITPVAIDSDNISLKWMDLFLDVERYAPGYRPPVAARTLSYIGLAAYETVVALKAGDYQSVAPNFAGLTIPQPEAGKSYHTEAAANEVYYVLMKAYFPHVEASYKAKIEALYLAFDASKIAADELTRSQQYGQAVANAVFDFSKTDAAGHEGYLRNQPTDYAPPTGAGKWQPTFPDYSRALLPYWGKVRTFVATEADQIARPPLAYSASGTSPFFAQALEVYTNTTPQTYDGKWIGEFWSDDIYKLTFEPAGRWLAVALQVVRTEKAPLEKCVYTFAKVGLSLHDVGVVCWNSKYLYNLERPVSYIRRVIDKTWQTKLNNPLNNVQGLTPPFPAYPSGHSCFGSAAAEVLTDIYGYAYGMTDRCHEGRKEFIGIPRSFNRFDEMAQENAISRIVLGVHYRMDCEEGLRLGYVVGRKINALKWKK